MHTNTHAFTSIASNISISTNTFTSTTFYPVQQDRIEWKSKKSALLMENNSESLEHSGSYTWRHNQCSFCKQYEVGKTTCTNPALNFSNLIGILSFARDFCVVQTLCKVRNSKWMIRKKKNAIYLKYEDVFSLLRNRCRFELRNNSSQLKLREMLWFIHLKSRQMNQKVKIK